MKKHLLLLLSYSIWLFGINAQSIDWDAIDFVKGLSVTGKVNGFNMGGYSYGRINNQGNNISVPSQCSQCGTSFPSVSGASFSSMQTKTNVISASAKLNPGVLRFPGGTHSGWYHLYEYNNQGFYDASTPQIDKGYGMTAIEAGHLKNPLRYCRLDSRITVNQNYITGFINYVKNVQNAIGNNKKIEITYVANLLTHFRFKANQNIYSNCGREKALTPMNNYDCGSTFDYSYIGNENLFNNNPDIYRFELYYKETQDAISKIVTELALDTNDVLYVEMGNEYYSTYGYPYSKYQMDVDDYSALIEIYSERLKCYFFDRVDIKIGAVTKPNTAWQTGLVNNLKNDLSGNGETLNEAIDAVIYHDYYTNSSCLNETDISARFNCAKSPFRNHIEIELPNKLDVLRKNFPDQKIWITEWNMLKGDANKNNSYINTILHAAFVQEYALGILEYNRTHSNVVSMLTHHRLGDHNVWSVIQTRDGSNTEANYRSGAYAMEYISKLYDFDSINIVGNILTDGTSTFDTKEATINAFVQYQDGTNSSDKFLLFFTNKTNNDINYIIPDIIDNVKVNNAKISFLKGNHLFTYGPRNTTAGKNQFKKTASSTSYNSALDNLGYGAIDNRFYSTTDSILRVGVSNLIPKNSIGVIEIFLDDITMSTAETENIGYKVIIQPNPTSESITLSIDAEISELLSLQLFSVFGKEVINLQTKINKGNNLIQLNTNNLIDGIYYLTIGNRNHLISKKVIIKHN